MLWKFWLLIPLVLAGFEPKVSVTQFDSTAKHIRYFDDSATILSVVGTKLYKSTDDGVSWNDITKELGNDVEVLQLIMDPSFKDRAFVTSKGKVQYVTTDKAKSWKKFNLDIDLTHGYDSNIPTSVSLFVHENHNDRNLVLLNALDCTNIFECKTNYFYTENEFNSELKRLNIDNPIYCTFTATLANRDSSTDERHVACVSSEKDHIGRVKASNLITSSDWFQTHEIIDYDAGQDTVIYSMSVIDSFLVISAFSDRYNDKSYVNLYISKDGKTFKKAHFPGDLVSESFTLLPSNAQSLYVSVWGFKKKVTSHLSTVISDLYASDSDGYSFRKLDKLSDSSNFFGFHSVEKISNLEGVWLANIMVGYDGFSFFPNVQSRMSFDDGRTWDVLKFDKSHADCGQDECYLNLISAIEMTGDGVFQSGPSPGLLFGVGSVGNNLDYNYDKLKTWVSRDGGVSWKVAIDEPCVFSMGDQGNVVLAMPFMRYGDEIKGDRSVYYYSLDQGEHFEKKSFDKHIVPALLTTTVDGSSSKFLFSGYENTLDGKFLTYSLDFSNAFDGKTCQKSDFEEFEAGKQCIMGRREKFRRRKQDAKCLVNKLFDDVIADKVPCDCSKEDFECASGFQFNANGECVPDFKFFREVCVAEKTKKAKVAKLSKIPGNQCQNGFSLKDSDYFDLNCEDILKNSASKDITTQVHTFPGDIYQYVYLKQNLNNVKDETILVLTTKHRLYISHNGGLNFFWASMNDDEILAILEDKNNGDHIVLITTSNTVYVSKDRAQSFRQVKTPSPVNTFGFVPIVFHPKDENTFIFLGSENCDSSFSNDCHTVLYLTENNGESWIKLFEDGRQCDFFGARLGLSDSENLLICEKINPDRTVKIVASSDKFVNVETYFERTVGIAPDESFLIVAAIDSETNTLKSYTTVDGKTWAHAKFPPDFNVDKEQAYTIIKSNSRSIYMHVTTSLRSGSEFGSLLKSNSNGTSYVLSENYVNRNAPGYVDFEKVEGIEGLSIINVVANPDDVLKGANKKLKTKITHNDAAEWAYLQPPTTNSKGERYSCVSEGKSLEECSLNLHGYTERVDHRDTYSSGSAVGILIGFGNVGPELLPRKDCSTFITRDGGITWKEINSKALNWEYGDQGSIIVLVNQHDESNTVLYSLDEGDTWAEYEFNSENVRITDIATIPSDTSRRFLIFGTPKSDAGDNSKVFLIDFTNVYSRQCKLDVDNFDSPDSDFVYWSPKHPFLADNCLFGHEAKYLRRKASSSDCYVGNAPLNEAYKVTRNCSCTRRDFECDYNFVRQKDGTCKLVKGLKPKDPQEICLKENVFEYSEPTGYRKIPLSTCENGQELDKWETKPCPGKEAEYDKKHGSGLKGFNLFLVVFIPVGAFIFCTWFVYDRGIRRNGGFARFGQIRLEDEADLPRVENNLTDKIVNRIVDVGVLIFLAGVGVVSFLRGERSRSGGLGRYQNLNRGAFLDDDDILGSEEDDDGEEDAFIVEDDQFDDDARSLSTVNQD